MILFMVKKLSRFDDLEHKLSRQYDQKREKRESFCP